MKISAILILLLAMNASAEVCENVIQLSKVVTDEVSDQDSVEQQADHFCSDYSKSIESGSAMDAGGSYGLFSASVGMSKQSAQAVASKYCSSKNKSQANKNAFKTYVESIAPKAYQAYERCLELKKKEKLKFSVDPAAIKPHEFSVSASFVSDASSSPHTQIGISSSDGVTCDVDKEKKDVFTIPTGSTVAIKCKRQNIGEYGYVTFVNKDSGSDEPLTLPWPAHTPEGLPKSTLFSAEQRIKKLEDAIERFGVEAGAIQLKAVDTDPLSQTSKCEEGAKGLRGEKKGRVTFKTAFIEPPVVNLGIASLDSSVPSNTGMRLAISVLDVDRKGFDYSFVTWCYTSISGATANWIAVSR